MPKQFTEVFPTLKLNQDLAGIFGPVTVVKVSANKHKDFIRIYITAERLIQKAAVFQVEEAIKKQLFPYRELTVKIYEHYRLSAQYTPEKFLHIYRDSVLLELLAYSPIMHNIFKNAVINYPVFDLIELTVADSVPARSKGPELVRILEKICNDRCGLAVTVQTVYHAAETGKYREEDEQKIKRQIAEITARAAGGAGEDVGAGEALSGKFRPAAQPAAGYATDNSAAGNSATAGYAADNYATAGYAADNYATAGYAAGNYATDNSAAGNYAADNSAAGKPGRERPLKRSDHPDVLYGRDVEEAPLAMEDIVGEIGEVVVCGKILTVETRDIRNEKTIFIFAVSDFTDTITVKIFVRTEQKEELAAGIFAGAFVKIKGVPVIDKFDHELTLGSIAGIRKIPDFTTTRMDYSVKKRVELHCHTKMSDMDGVSEVKDIIRRACQWGHPAIAITDHGVVQAFPDANHVWDGLWAEEKKRCLAQGIAPPDKQNFFKIIYGCEAYLVDDCREIVTNDQGQGLNDEFVVFDLETTGFSPVNNRIIEIGAVRVSGGKATDRFSALVNPEVPIPFEIEKLTGIDDQMVLAQPDISKVLPEFINFCGDRVLVAHNAGFDMGFIRENIRRAGMEKDFTVVDTLGLARILLPGQSRHRLDAVAKTLHISMGSHHRAVDDAAATAEIFMEFCRRLQADGITELGQINGLGMGGPEAIRRQPSYHAIILAANNTGRENLYRLVSEAHLTYYSKRPRIPKSRLSEYREGLIVGSACEAGELYRALLEGKSDAELARIAGFYDYLEIQPTANNKFLIASEKNQSVNSVEDIEALNRRIVDLGEELNKPVAATCDVHFLDPEDEVYRRIIMAGNGFTDADDQAPLFLRTTEEMLAEFAYLGSDKAREVVITNPNLIADRIDVIAPVRPDKCAPVIARSDKILTDICFRRAHELYGEPLPEPVRQRLERELSSIISNGFAVMYIIAQKLVWKSLEDGYLVGSRGSVGSSFVATMAGITEVNPLAPHYYCRAGHYSDFDSAAVRAYAGRAGCDMPDRNCPVCGAPLVKEGFDIPFETFLGFKGDKEPDIDLNFSGEYQSKAHKYTEVIFGAGQTYRAGTISTLADKTAFGYVRKYYDERGAHKRICEINRIVTGCTGIRKSTGQHPGGIIVLPLGEDINSFTPVQHPANDMNTDIVTTHFDYHSIDHNLLKLDILGHDDPTMIRMLEDLTGVDPVAIPLRDDKIMSLFRNTEALGITPEQIGCNLGALGVPEFGTDFVIQMLEDTKPESFFDLICISGLSHGTDVWLGNAQDLIKDGSATISTVISTRDDIMTYLIGKGMDNSLSFTIMESVRKGKGLKPEWEQAMTGAQIPDWYIRSCKKIKYMFPKAHAAAYVMMAWRIAYYKVYHPTAYYAAFFSIRASAFSYEIMCQGARHLASVMNEYERREDKLSKKEQDTYRDMRIVQEMYARGYEFTPIDIFSAHARNFQLVDGRIMPSLNSIDGLGEKAADAIVEASKQGPYLSRDDFRQRTRVSKTVVELMDQLKLLGNLPESNQISLFDLMM